MTSNKVDGLRETLAGRASHGQAFFDPNRIYRLGPQPDFVFTPSTTSQEPPTLAVIFEASTRKASERGGDSQFDTAGRDLLAYFFCATAQRMGRPSPTKTTSPRPTRPATAGSTRPR